MKKSIVLVIVICATVLATIIFTSCSSDSNESTSAYPMAELAWTVFTPEEEAIMCSFYWENEKETIIEAFKTADDPMTTREAEGMYQVMNREC